MATEGRRAPARRGPDWVFHFVLPRVPSPSRLHRIALAMSPATMPVSRWCWPCLPQRELANERHRSAGSWSSALPFLPHVLCDESTDGLTVVTPSRDVKLPAGARRAQSVSVTTQSRTLGLWEHVDSEAGWQALVRMLSMCLGRCSVRTEICRHRQVRDGNWPNCSVLANECAHRAAWAESLTEAGVGRATSVTRRESRSLSLDWQRTHRQRD